MWVEPCVVSIHPPPCHATYQRSLRARHGQQRTFVCSASLPHPLDVRSPVFSLDEAPPGVERKREVAAAPISGQRPRLCFEQASRDTDLTSPVASPDTPLQPSRPRVHAFRSPGFKFALLHVPSAFSPLVPALGVHRSFSKSSTSRSLAAQCLSCMLSSSMTRMRRA